MQRVYYTINEKAAKTANDMMSFSDYRVGSKTAEYQRYVNKAYDLADKVAEMKPDESERAYRLAERYSRKMAENMNASIHIGCMCPSVMISGAGNFPVKKKEKQNAAADKNYQQFNEIQGIQQKIESILYGKEVIKSGDERAVEKLEEKLENLQEQQELMKAVNAYYRKNKTVEGCPELTPEQAIKLQEAMKSDWHYEDKPFASYQLSNNNQNIRSTEDRLKRLKAAKEKGIQETECKFFKIVRNAEDMRLQLLFDGKPGPEVREILKSNGFRWAPSNQAWQRHLNGNSEYSLKRVIEQMEKMEAVE